MSLAARLIFAITALLLTPLFVWAANFGGPMENTMWVFAALSIITALIFIFIVKSPNIEPIRPIPLEKTDEPTWRLINEEDKTGPAWTIKLGERNCILADPSGEIVQSIPRQYSQSAIFLPSFLGTNSLSLIKSSQYRTKDTWFSLQELFREIPSVFSWRRQADKLNFYHFCVDPEFVQTFRDYLAATPPM